MKKKKMLKYIVTTAQTGALLNKQFYTNLKSFADSVGVESIYVFIAKGMYRDDTKVDPRIMEDENLILIEEGKENINEMLTIQHSQIPMQAVDPLRGLASKLKNTSYILPGTKIRFRSVASPYDNPRAFMSTGSLTHPNYKEHTSQGMKAKEEHQYGFTFVRVKDKNRFEAVPITVNKNGTFNFFNIYCKDGDILETRPDSMVLGDWHVGDTCPWVRKETKRLIQKYKPTYVVLHDFFNGHSINHHERDNLIAKIRAGNDNRISLEKELKESLKELHWLANLNEGIELIVVNSNHDEWLTQWIMWGRFVEHNGVLLGCRLLPKLISRKAVALEEALKLVGDLPDNVTFLREGESFKRYGVELGIHGHKGTNGSRGTPNQFKSHNIRAITGHTHTPYQTGNSLVVGTSTLLNLDYNKGGMSSWMNAHAFLYPDGNFHLITLIK